MAVFVDRILSVEGTAPPAEEAINAAREAAVPAVTLAGGETLALDPDAPETPHYAQMLGMLQHAGMPVYLQTNAETERVERLLIPRVLEVRDVASEAGTDTVEVQLHPSHARHFVRTTNPDHERILAALGEAQRDGRRLLITEDPDTPEIIDVRPANTPLAAPVVDQARESPPPTVSAVTPVSAARAQQMFDLAAQQTCPTNASVLSCIPFLYPEDGCWARAHEMCRLFIMNGVTPMKVWLYGQLRVATKNSPACAVQWRYHVAPLLAVTTGFGSEQWVIDPALFASPVPLNQWIAVQQTSVPPSTQETTDAAVYFPKTLVGSADEYDPLYLRTNADLVHFRLTFANRCLIEHPPGPPYNCP